MQYVPEPIGTVEKLTKYSILLPDDTQAFLIQYLKN